MRNAYNLLMLSTQRSKKSTLRCYWTIVLLQQRLFKLAVNTVLHLFVVFIMRNAYNLLMLSTQRFTVLHDCTSTTAILLLIQFYIYL
jgi:hypothetical protein